MDSLELTEASTRLIGALNKRYKLVSRLRIRLEHAEELKAEPLLEHLHEAECAFEKIVARMSFLTSRVKELASAHDTPNDHATIDHATIDHEQGRDDRLV